MKLEHEDEALCASYMKNAFYNRKDNFKVAREALKDIDFDTIVCTGISGAVFGPTLAYLMEKQLVVVRKSLKGTHSSRRLEANCKPQHIGKWTAKILLFTFNLSRKLITILGTWLWMLLRIIHIVVV